MNTHFDTIVVGVGGMGSATVYHLAGRGQRVLGLEQFDICHEYGSSHGFSRIIRMAYFEHPDYVPLLREAYALWHQLERDTDRRLLIETGSLDLGIPGTPMFDGAMLATREHQLEHRILDSVELQRLHPAFHLPAEYRALFQPQGGFLIPEACIAAHVEAAQRAGADVRAREPVLSWESNGQGVTVHTTRGTYTAGTLVLCGGGWMSKLLPHKLIPLWVERQVLGWFQPAHPEWFQPGRLPVWNLEIPDGRYYGLPIQSVPGFKFARYHHRQQSVDPDAVDRTPDEADREVLRSFVRQYFPDADGPVVGMRVCTFTMTPDEHFVLDRHPEYGNVVVVSPCSGHGFKFCSVVGKIAADLAIDGRTDHKIDWLRLARFQR